MAWRMAKVGVWLLSVVWLGAQTVEDPVMKMKARRSAAGMEPPEVARPVGDPPGLPPTETHLKDTRGYRAHVVQSAKRVKRGKVRGRRPESVRVSRGRGKRVYKAPAARGRHTRPARRGRRR